MAQTPKNDKPADQIDRIAKELEMLKKLAILDLSYKGFSQADIADALGVSQATVSRMFPKGMPEAKAH